MEIQLPPVIQAYFQSANARDIEGVLQCFARDAWVHDENKDMRGIQAIREWKEAGFKKYAVVMTPSDASVGGNQILVIADVAGNFPGSPIPLRFTFTLGDGIIAALDIRP